MPKLWIVLLLLSTLTVAVLAKPGPAPTRASAAKIRLNSALSGADLYRIRVGSQAGLLKIFGKDSKEVKYLKDSADSDVGGIDGLRWAPVNATQRDAILEALEIQPTEADQTAAVLMSRYAELPNLEALALLGVLALPGISGSLPDPQALVAVRFLEGQLRSNQGNVRRQAALALALRPTVDAQTIDSVLNFLQRIHNNWETFTTVQFFTNHQREILAMADVAQIKKRIQESGNPHAELILERLNTIRD